MFSRLLFCGCKGTHIFLLSKTNTPRIYHIARPSSPPSFLKPRSAKTPRSGLHLRPTSISLTLNPQQPSETKEISIFQCKRGHSPRSRVPDSGIQIRRHYGSCTNVVCLGLFVYLCMRFSSLEARSSLPSSSQPSIAARAPTLSSPIRHTAHRATTLIA